MKSAISAFALIGSVFANVGAKYDDERYETNLDSLEYREIFAETGIWFFSG